MIRQPSRGLFVTGTDTQVGKTYVAALIAQHLRGRGFRVGVYKPVASGCDNLEIPDAPSDAQLLWEAAGKPLALRDVCPQWFAAPLAPPAAAALEGRQVDSGLLRRGLEVWAEQCDVIVVEGVGGLFAPVSDDELVADLACDLGYPLLIVAANRLGTINHTLLTLQACHHYRVPLPVIGTVLNDTAPSQQDASAYTNRQWIERFAHVPILAHIHYGQTTIPQSFLDVICNRIGLTPAE